MTKIIRSPVVVSSGCSFIWGSELSDDNADPRLHSKKTWPALFAQSIGAEYYTAAVPGGSNATIARSVIEWVEEFEKNSSSWKRQEDDLFFIVQWTFPSRQEFRFKELVPNNKCFHYFSISPWTTNKNEERDKLFDSGADDRRIQFMRESHRSWKEIGILDFSDQYFEHISCEDTDVYNMFKEIVHLKLFLESKNIKYAFSTASSNLLRKFMKEDASTDVIINAYAKIVREIPWVYFHPNGLPVPMGFYDWAVTTRQKQGAAWHPLDEAHEIAFNLAKEQLYALAKIDH